MGTESREPIPVPEDVAELLNRIAVEWVPPRFPDRNIEKVEWEETDLSTQARRLHVNGHLLEMLCALPTKTIAQAREERHEEIPLSRYRGALRGCTQDGLSFEASQAITTGSTERVRATSVETEYVVRSHDWAIWNEAKPARLWVASIEINSSDLFGNLMLKSGRGSSWGHFRLHGSSYTYYLINLGAGKRRQILAVDAHAASYPDPDLLRRELTYLSFAFGNPISVENLFGLDVEGRMTGLVGGTFAGRDAGRWWDSVVPMFEHKSCWVAPLFRRLCEFHASRDTRELGELTLGIWYLLSSYRETSADIRRMEMFVGLTCVARHLEKNRMDLADAAAWNAWLDEHRSTIDEIARDQAEDAFVGQLRRSAFADNVSIVTLAMKGVGMRIEPLMQAELESATQGLRGEALEFREKVIDEAAVLRCLLVALVAKVVKYDGAIAGWQRVGEYFYWDRAPADWWPVSENTALEARTTYLAKTNVGPTPVKEIWPTFSIVTAPNTGPIGAVVSFATALALKTGGIVAAKVVPVPRENKDAPQLYDFVLYAAASPRTRSVLFTVQEKDPQTLVILDWDENDRVVDVNRELEEFLALVANAPETQHRIERLAVAAELETPQ